MLDIPMQFFADIKAIRALVTHDIDSLGDCWLVVYEYSYVDTIPVKGPRYWHCEFKLSLAGMDGLYNTCDYYSRHKRDDFLPHLLSVVRIDPEAHDHHKTTEISKLSPHY